MQLITVILKSKIILISILTFFLILFLHNAWHYSPLSGYDAGIHTIYTKILIFEKRIPTSEETPESYNPPMFYYLSGKVAQTFAPLFNNNILEALKSWQILIALLLPLVGYLWYDIFLELNPKSNNFALFFLFWFLSLPILNKIAPMYNIETPQLILSSVIIWFFIKNVIKKPTTSRMIKLGLLSGLVLSMRIMSFTLLLSLGFTIILFYFQKKLSFAKMLSYGLIFTITTLVIGGQYYFLYANKGAFDGGDDMSITKQTPIYLRQPKSFYVDTFFRTSMKKPIRPSFPNRFIPIFYSTFWGDYWNYYRHQRYPLSQQEEAKFNLTALPNAPERYKISKERLDVLAWQNRINLIPSILLIVGMMWSIKKAIKNFFNKNSFNHQQVSEIFLTTFFVISFIAFFYISFRFPNTYKGDSIKASYILYAIPCLIYFATKLLVLLKQKFIILYYLLLIIIIVSFPFNLNFNYY